MGVMCPRKRRKEDEKECRYCGSNDLEIGYNPFVADSHEVYCRKCTVSYCTSKEEKGKEIESNH